MKKLLNFKLILSILIVGLLSCLFLAFYIPKNTAFATSTDSDLFIPTDRVEYYDFSNSELFDAVKFDGGLAVILSSSSQKKLLIYSNSANSYIEHTGFDNPTQVKLYNQNTLIVLNGSFLYTVDLMQFNMGNLNKEYFSTSHFSTIEAHRFDVYGNTLVTKVGTRIYLYDLAQDTRTDTGIDGKEEAPVCVNDVGQVFYVSNESKLIQLSTAVVIASGVSPDSMIANSENVFIVENGYVKKISLSSVSAPVTFSSTSQFELGKVGTAKSLSFNGQNLIVTDNSLNAIQEFSIENDYLIFTGFAVSKNRTAFNRVSEGGKVIERFNDNVAILDNVKLTIIKADENFSGHDKECFSNIFLTDLGSPNKMTLGDTNLLLGYDDNTLKFLTIGENAPVSTDITCENGVLMDAYYSRGRYYALYRKMLSNGIGNVIISFNEDGSDCVEEYSVVGTVSDTCPEKICVDVLGNVYLANSDSVFKNGELLCQRNNFIDFNVDFFGNLFAIKENQGLYYNGTAWVNCFTANDIITGFCLNFEKSEVYYLENSTELIYKTENFKNTAISSLSLPHDFNTHVEPSNSNFTAFTAIDGKFIACVNTEDGIKYDKITDESTFVLLSENLSVSTVNGDKSVYLLAGEKSIVIAPQSSVNELVIEKTAVSKSSYVATPVNAYALPVITDENVYTILRENSVKRLNKGVIIQVSEQFNFLGRDYYFATVTEDDNSFKCYIPSSFTVDVLAEDITTSTFSYCDVNACDVFIDQEMTTKLVTLDEQDTLILLEIKDGVAKVGVTVDGEILEGYILEDNILDPSNLIVRNILIILAVLACVCGSLSFFLLRRKK